MAYLLDTNIVSEWVKPAPDTGVIRWLAEVDEDLIHLSVLTFAELRHGIERMHAGRRKTELSRWLENDLFPRFTGRILPVNLAVCDTWGRLITLAESKGRPVALIDGFFAATAKTYDLTFVTRNTRHFTALKIPLLNPFTRPANQTDVS